MATKTVTALLVLLTTLVVTMPALAKDQWVIAFGEEPFTLNPAIISESLAFALFMGLVGGFLPALRASRLNIVDALRAA